MIKLCVETIEHPDYLEFVCSGDHIPHDWEELVELTYLDCQRTRKTRVLIDVLNLDFGMENMTRYRMGLLVAEKFGSSVKIAALTPQEHINFFWETVAHNRGARVKTSSDRETLIAWLSEVD